MTIYIIDTSALINLARWYPMDRKFFMPIWSEIDKLINSKRLFAPYEVYREISERSDELLKWAKSKKEMFIHPTSDQIRYIGQIKQYYTKRYWERESNKTGAWADPWIIALAIHYNNSPLVKEEVMIVTEENKIKPNRIPVVASNFGINSLNILEFLWELGIR